MQDSDGLGQYISTFILIETELPYMKSLNKGFNGEDNKGFYHLYAHNPDNGNLLIRKPITPLVPSDQYNGIFITNLEYKSYCIPLLTFNLFNN